MAIYEILQGKTNNHILTRGFFNGSLENYINSSYNRHEQFNGLFEELLETVPELQICANLPIEISVKAISNQIIRYKDAFKLPEHSVIVPLILYWRENEQDKAIMFATTDYIEAKGLYYCLTEPDLEFGQCRNEILTMCLKEEYAADIKNALESMHSGSKAAGAIQRSLDRRYINNVDEMKERAVVLAKEIFDNASEQLLDMEERGPLINETIARIFLIKKALYVQYMMSKDLLANRHEGDVKKQRQFAKAYSDEVPIVSLSSLWRMTREDKKENEESL